MPGAHVFPCAEAVFGGMKLQPYVHSCIVTVECGVTTSQFMVYFKRHRYLPVNQALPGLDFHGEVLVMRMGRDGTVVNMRGGDGATSDWLSVEYVDTRFRERQLTFHQVHSSDFNLSVWSLSLFVIDAPWEPQQPQVQLALVVVREPDCDTAIVLFLCC